MVTVSLDQEEKGDMEGEETSGGPSLLLQGNQQDHRKLANPVSAHIPTADTSLEGIQCSPFSWATPIFWAGFCCLYPIQNSWLLARTGLK